VNILPAAPQARNAVADPRALPRTTAANHGAPAAFAPGPAPPPVAAPVNAIVPIVQVANVQPVAPPAAAPVAAQIFLPAVTPIAPALPPPPPVPINNSLFPFWPSTGDTAASLPDLDDDPSIWREGPTCQLHPNGTPLDEDEEKEWHGVHMLGKGATGRVGLWVKIDENDNIIDRIAIKDSQIYSRERWACPLLWRDQLPREIAIQERLRTQGGRPTIHAYHGYCLNMKERRYRLYNEVCDYGNLRGILDHYSKLWAPRTVLYAENWKAVKDLPEPADVIPESFLWEVFRALVDACLFMRDGATRTDGETPLLVTMMPPGQEWRPIMHCDIHLQNVFVKVPDAPKQAPRIVLADFDTAFFDLQERNGNSFADNPTQYFRGEMVKQSYVDNHPPVSLHYPFLITLRTTND
jgi:hypothetical protein